MHQAQYHFHLDEEAQSYRVIGLTARLCFEMGLHRREVLVKAFSNEEECAWATKVFWSIYVLDRRWSFGTGMPFALQDADIDPLLPEPVSLLLASAWNSRADEGTAGQLNTVFNCNDSLQSHFIQGLALRGGI